MKIIFNDLSELQIQQIRTEDDYLMIKTVSAQPEKLRELFSDENKTRKIQVVSDRGSVMQTYEGYITFYRTEEYTGGIYGVTNYKPDLTPEAKAELLESSVKVAKIQAQSLSDEAALTVQNLYPEWIGEGAAYEAGYKVQYNSTLYKCLQAHRSQVDWNPEDAHSLWTKVLHPDPGVIPEWQQPDSINGYMTGDKVMHNEKSWVSTVDNNVWEPGAVGTENLWKEVSE